MSRVRFGIGTADGHRAERRRTVGRPGRRVIGAPAIGRRRLAEQRDGGGGLDDVSPGLRLAADTAVR